jgi:hypothetical protein
LPKESRQQSPESPEHGRAATEEVDDYSLQLPADGAPSSPIMRSPKSAHDIVDMFQQKDKASKKRKYEPDKQDEVDSESFYFEIQ